MKHHLSLACLLAAASAQAGWLPGSPILQVGDDLDVYFIAKARLEYESNIFLGSPGLLPNSGASWSIGPGFAVDFAKESNFSSSLNWRRDFVHYFNSQLKTLDDERDVGGANFTYDGGGPMTFQLVASYGEDARNTPELNALATSPGTLLRTTAYSQSATLGYRFTDKLAGSLAAVHRSNRYDPVLVRAATASPPVTALYNTESLVEADGWSFPLDLRYQVRERLNIGLAYEHGHSNIYAAHGSSQSPLYTGFTKDFYGITLSGQPTASGKLDATVRAGVLRSAFDGGSDSRTSGSYSFSLTHTLTEKLNHALNFADDASIAVNGARNRGQSASYIVNYVMNEAFRASAFVALSTNFIERAATGSAETKVRAGSYGLTATYSPDTHWTYEASYTLTQAYDPTTYNVHRFSLEANLRW